MFYSLEGKKHLVLEYMVCKLTTNEARKHPGSSPHADCLLSLSPSRRFCILPLCDFVATEQNAF